MKIRLYLNVVLAAMLLAVSAPSFVQADTLVVLNKSEATASLIDLESWRIVRLLEADREPDGMAYSALDVKTD
jgi:hypothetical protein